MDEDDHDELSNFEEDAEAIICQVENLNNQQLVQDSDTSSDAILHSTQSRKTSRSLESQSTPERQRRLSVEKLKRASLFQTANQHLREKGKAYQSKSIDKNGNITIVNKDAKVCGPPCSATSRCWKSKLFDCKTLTEDDRMFNFNTFWDLNKDAKRIHLLSLTDSRPPIKPKNIDIKRKFCASYFLKTRGGEKLRVCKTMLCNTLGMNQRSLTNWLNEPKQKKKARRSSGESGLPGENDSESPLRRVIQNKRVEKLRDVLCSLSTIPSHYARAQTDCVFLERHWASERKMYKWYKKEVCASDIVSRTTFTRVLRSLKMKIFTWKKDRCDFCEKERLSGNSPTATDHYLEQKQAIKDKNLLKADIKNRPGEEAFCFDVEAALTFPRIFCSAAHFRLKMLLSNFTFLNYKTGKVTCLTFTERDAGHEASVYTTCILEYMENYLGISSQTKRVTLISDSCVYQNKNKFLGNALLHLAMSKSVEVEHRYLCVGHTHLEIDSYHSVVEKNFRNSEQHVPEDYHRSFIDAHDVDHRVEVVPLEFDFFKDYSACPYVKSLRPGVGAGSATVASVRAFLYTPDGKILFKLRSSDEFKILPGKVNSKANWPELQNLYTRKQTVSPGKLQHIRELMPFVPEEKRDYFENHVFK